VLEALDLGEVSAATVWVDGFATTVVVQLSELRRVARLPAWWTPETSVRRSGPDLAVRHSIGLLFLRSRLAGFSGPAINPVVVDLFS